ncbi:MAG TPA: hypothetical protein VMV94_21180 [Phycisphaerae bacterium]|nr:hypothetical protein [Phycisphaerae bacterium]
MEINLLLKSFDDLVEFYEEQGRWADKEQALRQRIEICRKLAELRMLAEADGPGAAMQEFYRSIHRPDRALELDLHNLGRELDRLAQKGAELDAEMARLAARRDLLERKMSELNERRDQRLSELSDMQKRLRMEQADPDDADDEDEDVGDTWYGPERDLSKPLDAVEAALTDRGMEDSSRERLEWRRGRILRTMQRDAVDPQVPVRKAAQADPNSAASGDSTSGLGEAALLNMLEPPCRPDPDGESYAKQRVERNFAEIESRLQPVEAPLDQTVASGIMGPPDDRD